MIIADQQIFEFLMLRLLDVWGIEFMADSIEGILVKCLEKDSRVYTIRYLYEF